MAELTNGGIDRAIEVMSKWEENVIEMTNGWVESEIEVMNGWADEVTELTEDGTEGAIERTGVLIGKVIIGSANVQIVIRIEGVIVAIIGITVRTTDTADTCILGTTIDTVDIGIHGITIGIVDIDIPDITMDIVDI